MSVNRITSSQEIITALQPVPNFKSKNEIKTWIHDILDGRGINLVIERSDSSKAVFKCKNLHRKQNTPRPSISSGDLEDGNKKKRMRSILEDSCPFRLRVSYSVKNKNWSVNIINEEHNPALCSNFGNHNGGSVFPTPNSNISTPIGTSNGALNNRKRCLSNVYNTPSHLHSPQDSPLVSQVYGTPEYSNDMAQPSQSYSNKRGKLAMLEEFKELEAVRFQHSKNNVAFQRSQLVNLQLQSSSSGSPHSPYQLPSQERNTPKQQQQKHHHHHYQHQQQQQRFQLPSQSEFNIPDEIFTTRQQPMMNHNSNDTSLLLNHRRTETSLSEVLDEFTASAAAPIHEGGSKSLLDSLDFELNLFNGINRDHAIQSSYDSPTNSIPISPLTNLPLAPFSLKSQSNSAQQSASAWSAADNNQVDMLFDQDLIMEFFSNPNHNYDEDQTLAGLIDTTAADELLLLPSQNQSHDHSVRLSPPQVSLPSQSQQLTIKPTTSTASASNSNPRYRQIQPAPAKALSSYLPIQQNISKMNSSKLNNGGNGDGGQGYTTSDMEVLDKAMWSDNFFG